MKRGVKTVMDLSKFGIYLNAEENTVVRINSPYWIPPAEQCAYLTPEVNMTLLKIRELALEKGLVTQPDKVVWTSIPVID